MRRAAKYLAQSSVRKAIHVIPNPKGMQYERTAGDLLPLSGRVCVLACRLIAAGTRD